MTQAPPPHTHTHHHPTPHPRHGVQYERTTVRNSLHEGAEHVGTGVLEGQAKQGATGVGVCVGRAVALQQGGGGGGRVAGVSWGGFAG